MENDTYSTNIHWFTGIKINYGNRQLKIFLQIKNGIFLCLKSYDTLSLQERRLKLVVQGFTDLDILKNRDFSFPTRPVVKPCIYCTCFFFVSSGPRKHHNGDDNRKRQPWRTLSHKISSFSFVLKAIECGVVKWQHQRQNKCPFAQALFKIDVRAFINDEDTG